MIECCGGVSTTNKYWDCECDNDYIHPKSQHRCEKCGANSEESPDAHALEVMRELCVSIEDL